MPNRQVHNRAAGQFGIQQGIADRVNRLKDRPSQRRSGVTHRGFNHGIGTNMKYRFVGGPTGILASLIHNRLDRVDGYRKRGIRGAHFTRERILTWTPGKGVKNLFDPLYGGD